jgi:hypothetical protein
MRTKYSLLAKWRILGRHETIMTGMILLQQFGKICTFMCLHNALLFKECDSSRMEYFKFFTGSSDIQRLI